MLDRLHKTLRPIPAWRSSPRQYASVAVSNAEVLNTPAFLIRGRRLLPSPLQGEEGAWGDSLKSNIYVCKSVRFGILYVHVKGLPRNPPTPTVYRSGN